MAGMNQQTDLAELVLSERDRVSDVWLRLRERLLARLDLLRRQNDLDLTPEKTALLRGRIAELKNLLAAGESQDGHE
jgi:hypothetical protein